MADIPFALHLLTSASTGLLGRVVFWAELAFTLGRDPGRSLQGLHSHRGPHHHLQRGPTDGKKGLSRGELNKSSPEILDRQRKGSSRASYCPEIRELIIQ